jgi:hypothetical protein
MAESEHEQAYETLAPGRSFKRGARALGQMLSTVLTGLQQSILEQEGPVQYRVEDWPEEKCNLFGGEGD